MVLKLVGELNWRVLTVELCAGVLLWRGARARRFVDARVWQVKAQLL
jgi:hypothetical protein|tara:strand:+ start:1483 stop:1623 length:141 start_codon:yes stop_codon:yes gene_type:complete